MLANTIWYFEHIHGLNHWLHGHEYVLEHQFYIAMFIVVRVAATVYNTHLFDERRFAGLARACEYWKAKYGIS